MTIKINLCLVAALVMATLQADEIYVTSSADSGVGTLRTALQAASPADFIIFDQSLSKQTIMLESDLPPINAKLNIVGPTNGNAILHGNDQFRLFKILGGAATIKNVDLLHPDVLTPGGTLFVDSDAAVSLLNLSITSASSSVFANQYSQIMVENISILPIDQSPLAVKSSSDHTFVLFPGSQCTICSDLEDMTPITAAGSGNITTMGSGRVALDTLGETVGFAIHAQEGTLLFTGNSTQPIVVGPRAVLRGNNGSLYLSNRGMVKTGQSIGVSSIIGDLIQVSVGVLEAEIAPNGASDLYLVGGNANLAGSLFVLAERGGYLKGSTFTFLKTDGVVNGLFDSVSTNAAGLSYQINYFPQAVQIEILQNLVNFNGYSLHGNAAKIYPVLANADVSAGSDLAEIISLLSALDSSSDLERGLNALQPSALGGLHWNEASILYHLNALLLQERGAFCGKNCLKNQVRSCCPSCKKNGVWISGLADRLHQGALGELRGFKGTTYGGLVGYDRAISEQTTLGIAGGYTNGHLSWDKQGGKTSIQRYTGAVYLAFCLGRLQVDLSATGSFAKNDIKRGIHFPGMDRKASSDPNGGAIMGHLGGRYLFVTNHFKITPFINGEYFYTKTNSFKEQGARSINLHTKGFSTDFVRGEAGVAIGEEFCTSWGIFSPALSLSYVRFSSLSNTHIKAKFASIPKGFSVKTAKHAFNEIASAASLGFSAGNNVWIFATYEGEFAKKRQDQAISLNMRVQF